MSHNLYLNKIFVKKLQDFNKRFPQGTHSSSYPSKIAFFIHQKHFSKAVIDPSASFWFNLHFLFPLLSFLSFYVTAALHYIANWWAFNKHLKHLNTSTFIHLICTQFFCARRRDCIINKQALRASRGLNSNEQNIDGGKFLLSLKTFCIL